MQEDTMEGVDFTNLDRVVAAIINERSRQSQHWSAAHDYGHSMPEWAHLITRYALRATDDGQSIEQAQEQLIKAAALCVAAIQSMTLWNYGPNPAAALNALATRIQAQSGVASEDEE